MERMERELDIAQFLEAMKKRWLLIVIIPLVISFASGIVSLFNIKPVVYQASTTLLIGKKAANSTTQQSVQLNAQQLAETYGTIAKSRTVAQNVIKELNIDLKPETLGQKITVNSKNTGAFEIIVTDNNPELAAQIANITAKKFTDAVIQIQKDVDINIIDTAVPPNVPIQAKKTSNVLIAFIFGLIVSIGLAFMLEYLDNTIKTSNDVEEILGIPVLGAIPFYKVKES